MCPSEYVKALEMFPAVYDLATLCYLFFCVLSLHILGMRVRALTYCGTRVEIVSQSVTSRNTYIFKESMGTMHLLMDHDRADLVESEQFKPIILK